MGDLSALHDMTLFVEVARTGNFSRASVNLGVPGATLSRRIAAMERAFAVRLFDRTDPSTMDSAIAEDLGGPITGAIVMPAHGPDRFGGMVSSASDDDMETFVDQELGGAIAIARKLSRYWKNRTDLKSEPRCVIVTNGKPDAALTNSLNDRPTSDESTMALAAVLPVALAKTPDEIAVIGWGSGLTTHTILGSAAPKRARSAALE